MSENWNGIFAAGASGHLLSHKTTITEHTPIMCNGRVVGHTIGENKSGYPIKCVLYSHPLFKEEMIDTDDAYRIASLEIKID